MERWFDTWDAFVESGKLLITYIFELKTDYDLYLKKKFLKKLERRVSNPIIFEIPYKTPFNSIQHFYNNKDSNFNIPNSVILDYYYNNINKELVLRDMLNLKWFYYELDSKIIFNNYFFCYKNNLYVYKNKDFDYNFLSLYTENYIHPFNTYKYFNLISVK